MLRLVVISIITFLLGLILGQHFLADQRPVEAASQADRLIENSDAELEQAESGQALRIQPPAPDSTSTEVVPGDDAVEQSWQSLVARSRISAPAQDRSAVPEENLTALIQQGIAPETARWALELWERYRQAQLTGPVATDLNLSALHIELQQEIRGRLGDAGYQSFLETLGLPSSMPVPDVLANSAAAVAGLRAGDQILRYDGQRIFNAADLLEASRSGLSGQSVTLEIERQGVPYTLVIPRGELGITRGGGSQLPLL